MSVPNSLKLSVLISMLSPKKDVANCTSSSFKFRPQFGNKINDQYIPIYLHCMYIITSIIYM